MTYFDRVHFDDSTDENGEPPADFLVLHLSGEITAHGIGQVEDELYDQALLDAMAPHVSADPDRPWRGTMMRWFRVFHDENFADGELPINWLADQMMRSLGYVMESGYWRGTVAVTMASNPGGYITPLTEEAIDAIEMLTALRLDDWACMYLEDVLGFESA